MYLYFFLCFFCGQSAENKQLTRQILIDKGLRTVLHAFWCNAVCSAAVPFALPGYECSARREIKCKRQQVKEKAEFAEFAQLAELGKAPSRHVSESAKPEVATKTKPVGLFTAT